MTTNGGDDLTSLNAGSEVDFDANKTSEDLKPFIKDNFDLGGDDQNQKAEIEKERKRVAFLHEAFLRFQTHCL